MFELGGITKCKNCSFNEAEVNWGSYFDKDLLVANWNQKTSSLSVQVKVLRNESFVRWYVSSFLIHTPYWDSFFRLKKKQLRICTVAQSINRTLWASVSFAMDKPIFTIWPSPKKWSVNADELWFDSGVKILPSWEPTSAGWIVRTARSVPYSPKTLWTTTASGSASTARELFFPKSSRSRLRILKTRSMISRQTTLSLSRSF